MAMIRMGTCCSEQRCLQTSNVASWDSGRVLTVAILPPEVGNAPGSAQGGWVEADSSLLQPGEGLTCCLASQNGKVFAAGEWSSKLSMYLWIPDLVTTCINLEQGCRFESGSNATVDKINKQHDPTVIALQNLQF